LLLLGAAEDGMIRYTTNKERITAEGGGCSDCFLENDQRLRSAEQRRSAACGQARSRIVHILS
jgi:hypothetical protein